MHVFVCMFMHMCVYVYPYILVEKSQNYYSNYYSMIHLLLPVKCMTPSY